jgi:hypothetical protein
MIQQGCNIIQQITAIMLKNETICGIFTYKRQNSLLVLI